MFGPSITTNRSRQAWIRAVVFVGLYLIVFLSLTQCALVLYLYGTAQVDGLMTPSLIISLIAVSLFLSYLASVGLMVCGLVISFSAVCGHSYNPLVAISASAWTEYAAQCATYGVFTSPSRYGGYVACGIGCGFGRCL